MIPLRSEPFEAAVRAAVEVLYDLTRPGTRVLEDMAEKLTAAVLAAALPPDPAPETPPTTHDEQVATQFCIDAAELPDRTSPDEYPDHLLITPEELTTMLLEAFAEVRAETIHALRARLLPGEEPS